MFTHYNNLKLYCMSIFSLQYWPFRALQIHLRWCLFFFWKYEFSEVGLKMHLWYSTILLVAQLLSQLYMFWNLSGSAVTGLCSIQVQYGHWGCTEVNLPIVFCTSALMDFPYSISLQPATPIGIFWRWDCHPVVRMEKLSVCKWGSGQFSFCSTRWFNEKNISIYRLP